MSTYFNTVGAS